QLRDLELGAPGVVRAHDRDLVGVGHVRVRVLGAGRVVPLTGGGGGVVVLLQLDLVAAGLATDRVEIDLHRVEGGVGRVRRCALEGQVHTDDERLVSAAAAGLAARRRSRQDGYGCDCERGYAPCHAGPLNDRWRLGLAEAYRDSLTRLLTHSVGVCAPSPTSFVGGPAHEGRRNRPRWRVPNNHTGEACLTP